MNLSFVAPFEIYPWQYLLAVLVGVLWGFIQHDYVKECWRDWRKQWKVK